MLKKTVIAVPKMDWAAEGRLIRLALSGKTICGPFTPTSPRDD